MPHLFDPFQLRSIQLRNRIGVSPMCQYSSKEGRASDWHLVHLGSRAVGGAGLVIMEATAVEPMGRITPYDNGIWSDEHIAPLQRITAFIKEQGAIAGIQIAHAGRKASRSREWEGDCNLPNSNGGWEVSGPSALPYSERYRTPIPLSLEDVQKQIANFAASAVRALKAGFQWLEIHAAHGYLIHSFYSPLSNHRKDQYGGNFENRIRLLMEITQAVRKVWPESLPLTVRLSCSDWLENGWTMPETIRLCELLKSNGVDLIDCSSGGNAPAVKIPVGASYQVPFSEGVRKKVGIPTAAVGMIREPMQADDIIRSGKADLVLLARELLRDPYWPLHAAAVLNQKKLAPEPPQYHRAF